MNRIIIILLLLVAAVSAHSQINLNTPHNGNQTYNIAAPEYVKMLPGFEYKPEAQTTNYFRAYIDPNAILPISYLEYPVDPENRPLDYNLAVGTTVGQASVSLSGAATYTIPIFSSPGTAGMQPQVSLIYNSQGGNGLAGYGWNIAGLSAITRVGHTIYHDGAVKGVDFSDDRFALDGQRLIKDTTTSLYGANGTIYFTEVFNGSKIISHNITGEGPEWFEVIGKDGSIVEYGKSDNSRLTSQRSDQTTITWYISKITDPNGNYIQFLYDKKPLEIYIKEIQYTGNNLASPVIEPYNSIKFFYGERTDKSTAFVAGSRLENNLLLDHIDVVAENEVVKRYKLKYYYDFYSKLNEVEEYNRYGERYNSLVFGYEDESTQSTTKEISWEDYDKRFVQYGDFNGDGLTDAFILAGEKHTDDKRWYVLLNNHGTLSAGGTGWSGNLTDNHAFSSTIGDFNGDGFSDIVLCEVDSDNVTELKIIYSTGSAMVENSNNYYIGISVAEVKINSGDFDGNGKDEIFILQDFGYLIRARILSIKTFNFSNGQYITDILFDNNRIATPETKLKDYFIRDFTADGIPELILSRDDDNYSFEIYRLSTDKSNSIEIIHRSNFPTKWHKNYLGDFNGDGITDVLSWNSSVWSLELFTGSEFVPSHYTLPSVLDDIDPINNTAITFVIGDYNSDGKDDIAYTCKAFGGTVLVANLFLLDGNEYIQKQFIIKEGVGTFEAILSMKFGYSVISDFNGDSNLDFCIVTNFKFYYSYITPDFKPLKIAKNANGFNETSKFTYTTLAQSNYTKESSAPSNCRDMQYPIQIVAKFETDNGQGDYVFKVYNYKGAIIHLQGKGFLGFKEIQTSSNITPIYSVTKNELNSVYYFLQPIESYTFKYNEWMNEQQISKNESVNQILSGFESTNKVFLPWQSTITEKDFATGNKKTTEITVDSYGNPLTQNAKYFDSHNATTEKASALTEYQEYWSAVDNIPSKPRTIISTVNRYDQAAITKTNKIAYNSKGNTTSTIDFFGLPKAVTTTYSDFTPVGLPKITTVSASGVESRVDKVELDNKFRFATKHTDAEGYITTTTYDPAFGNKLTVTSANEQTATMEYDGFGTPVKQTDDLGVWSKTEFKWYTGTTKPNVLYYAESTSNNGLTSAKYFDKLGRTLYATSTDPNGMLSCTQTVYNWKGQITSVSEPYFEGTSPTQFTTTTYHPDYGFAVSSTLPTGVTVTSTTPTPENSGRTSSVTNSATQITTSKTVDCTGNTISATDPGGTITYTYYSDGQPKEITAPDGGIVSITYDEYGRQDTLSDPDAGLMEYNYDAFGQLIEQKDAKGNKFFMYYDKLGRLIEKESEQTNEATNQVYVYYPATAAKGKRGALDYTQYTDEDGNYTRDTYQYNDKGQVTQKTIATDNNDKTFSYFYTYDTKGNPDEYTYPSGYTIKNEYNTTYGALLRVKEAQSGKILYAPGSYNARGQMNHYGIANQSIYTRMEYDIYGLPTFIKTGHSYPGSTNIQYLETQFDVQTGNLNYRKDHNYSVNGQILSETFAYDPVHKNRLASWQVTGQQAYTMTYATNNGNVLTKSDVTSAGNPYQYSGTQPHAVTSIHAPLQLPAETLQTITYNHFNSVKQILHSAEGKRLALHYGTDGQRVKTQYYTQNVTLAETKYFVGGDYEVEINHATGAQRRIHYLPGGGMYVLDQNNNSTLYYILTDYQGNHYKVINEQGNTIEHYSFDAWGKRRHATNWSYDNVPATFVFDRGYTGHEHLDEFGLINMNGRVYDPVIARFLSPDNYVQAPGSSQGFNRYSYCFNNPLKYSDPSGDFVMLAMYLLGMLAETTSDLIAGDGFNFKENNSQVMGTINGMNNCLQFTVYDKNNTKITAGLSPFTFGVSANVYHTEGDFTFHASGGIGFLGGASANGGINYYDEANDINIGIGAGGGKNYWGWNASATFKGYGAGYGQTYYNNAIGPDLIPHTQTVGSRTLYFNHNSFKLENDFLAPGGQDRWRTNAWELQIGDFSVGSYIYTNDPKNEKSGVDNRPSPTWGANRLYSTWKKGDVYVSPLYIGIRNGNTISRIGFSDKRFQDIQQNGIHQNRIFQKGNQNYYLNYDDFYTGIYGFSGLYSPFSLFQF